MDTTRLAAWLNLPPGPWPPDARTLLALGSGPVSAADAERAAMVRMALLRPHQLVDPELVTEGMNRLAQAMLAVAAAPAPISIPIARPPAEPVVALTAVAPDPVAVPPMPVGVGRAGRRLAYRELAGLRAVAAAWEALKPVAADPGEPFATPSAVCTLLEAAGRFRDALAHPGVDRAELTRLAPRLVAVFGHPQALAVARCLTRPQRQAVAREWAVGRRHLAAWRAAVRNTMRASRPGGTIGPIAGRLARIVAANPEWVLVLVGALGFAVAAGRLVRRHG